MRLAASLPTVLPTPGRTSTARSRSRFHTAPEDQWPADHTAPEVGLKILPEGRSAFLLTHAPVSSSLIALTSQAPDDTGTGFIESYSADVAGSRP